MKYATYNFTSKSGQTWTRSIKHTDFGHILAKISLKIGKIPVKIRENRQRKMFHKNRETFEKYLVGRAKNRRFGNDFKGRIL